MARYTGSCPKVKMQITGSDSVTYTYNLTGSEYAAFPRHDCRIIQTDALAGFQRLVHIRNIAT